MTINTDDFMGFDHGEKPIDLTELAQRFITTEMRPVQLHHKSNGAKDDKPSFTIVMITPDRFRLCAYGQVSFDMLFKALDNVGYTLTKKS